MSSRASPRPCSSRSERGLRRLLLVAVLSSQAACSSLSYYAQSARGQLGVMAASRPVEEVLSDPLTGPEVQRRLVQLPELHRFAREELGLVDSRSFLSYAEVGREALVWSVVAAPVDSLQARQWCYPLLGCASYRGYFHEAAARAYADELAGEGWDVAVEPVPAYSTLGWFSDPLPSTVIDWPMADIAALVFHEMAHEALYVNDDSAFNEAYATVVEKEGVRRWVQRYGTEHERREHARRERRRGDYLALLAATRERLQTLYAAGLQRDEMHARKAAVFARLRADYAAMKDAWGGYAGYDRWFARPLNNAHLASVDTYHAWEPALATLLQELGGDMAAFHEACRAIGDMPPAQRQARLSALLGDS